jgi:membrane-associated phospholipid phosphatase
LLTQLQWRNELKRLKSFLAFVKKLLLARWDSLLVILLGVCLPLLIFEQLAVIVWQDEVGFPWDEPILRAIHETATPQLDAFAVIFTKLGVFWGVFPIAIAISLFLLYLRRWRSLTYLLITLIGNVFINRIAKEFLHRVRPSLWDSLAPEFDYGFPSGHSMSSMGLVAALVILTWGSRWCWLVLLGGGLFTATIGWTRLYLGVHFPSDVLAGWMVSLAWAIGIALVIRPHLIKPSLVSEEALTISEQKVAEREEVEAS